MNFGKIIFDLRKKKNLTQEELAAELGVTAAAVSKWEKGYSLPDILMLCSLADFFQVSADTLLGRNPKPFCAAIATSSLPLLDKIEALVKRYGFLVKHKIYGSYEDAMAIVNDDPSVTHLFISFDAPMESHPRGNSDAQIIESQADSEEKILGGFEIYLKNMSKIVSIVTNHNA